MLVVLMSYYPGWKLLVDGKPAVVAPYNGYLGTKMLPGEHTYIFYFLPTQFIVSATISVITIALVISTLFFARRRAASPVKVMPKSMDSEEVAEVTLSSNHRRGDRSVRKERRKKKSR